LTTAYRRENVSETEHLTSQLNQIPIEAATAEEGSRRRKRKSDQLQPTKLDIAVDLTLAKAQAGLAMIAIIDIACLNPYWGKGLNANRPLRHDHVAKLIRDFKQSLRCFDPNLRTVLRLGFSKIEAKIGVKSETVGCISNTF